jgi:hypothetical protein
MARPFVLGFVLAGVLLCGGLTLADAAGIEDQLAGQLIPSAAPGLLGPITSAGRIGWACKPERAAAALDRHEAELPADPPGR